jgi:CheY-like chemotaxis protein
MKHIWLVDDDRIFLAITSKFLCQFEGDFNVSLYEKPKEALKKIEEGTCPDVLFLDINMPDMDGWAFLDTLSSLLPHSEIPDIYMLTSSIDPADIDLANQIALVKGFLEKPLTTEKLRHTDFFSFISQGESF